MAEGSFSQWCPCALKDLRARLSDETLRRGIIAVRLEGGGCAPAQKQDEYGSGGPDMHLTLVARSIVESLRLRQLHQRHNQDAPSGLAHSASSHWRGWWGGNFSRYLT